MLPSWLVIDPLLKTWLLEDIGRGDRTTNGLFDREVGIGKAVWIAKENGVIAGLPIAGRVFQLLDDRIKFSAIAREGAKCQAEDTIAKIEGSFDSLLIGERVALNIAMSLSGIATLTRQYADKIADLPTKLVDTRKTTPGLRILEKYATTVGGAINHRMGLDDAVMIKDNHIQASGGIERAIARLRSNIPYPLTIEVETTNLEEVKEAIEHGADIIMLDNMAVEQMVKAVQLIRQHSDCATASQTERDLSSNGNKKPSARLKIEASGNITLETIRVVAETGVDYISSSAPITRSTWLDLSMKIL
jgi:nicotinate-nucleotide pyrophosphorylase (carboxylating)